MAYKPQVKKSEGVYGPRGVAKVSLNKTKDKAKLVLSHKDAEDETYVVTEFPEYMDSGEWYISLNQDKDAVISCYPANGMMTVKVDHFAAPEGEEPAPRLKEASFEGKSYSYQQFTVLLDVLSPDKLKDVQMPLTLRYHFEEMEEEVAGKSQSVVAYAHPKSKYTALLMDFCDAVGLWEKGPMPFKPNILPMMAKRIAQADRKFQVVVKDGWVTTIFTMDTAPETVKEDDFTPDVEK